LGFSFGSLPSRGAPVPDEPMNSVRPSGKVMSRPLARIRPSFARYPDTTITVPTLIESRAMPLRCSVFGVPPSTIQISLFPSAALFSMWIQACGLIHSIFVTGPRSVTGALASNSAEKAWWARTGTVAATAMMAPRIQPL
jgi:hypothetical protein